MLAELATMIPEQLDLFGGPPKPPQKIRVEETIPPVPEEVPQTEQMAEDLLPSWIEEAQDSNAVEETIEENSLEPVSDEMSSLMIPDEQELIEDLQEPVIENTPDPISEVIAWMEPGDHEPTPVAPEPFIVPTASVVIELPAPRKKEVDSAHEKTSDTSVSANEKAVVEYTPQGEEPGMQQLNIPPDEILFKRQYYSMRETASMFDITHSMLRYWENEFDVLQPRKNRKGDRYFRPIDIKNLQLIYHLLKVRKFTLDGAREYLRNHNKALDTFELMQKLEKVKSFLHELKAHL
jgi:DNA-binding transcriptional MerR regulator